MLPQIDRKEYTKTIIKSQHTQRNWDLTKQIPEEDIQVLVDAATQCPSKQNFAFYKTHFITNREVIEKLHAVSTGLGYFDHDIKERVETTNSQVLANLVIALEEVEPSPAYVAKWAKRDNSKIENYKRDKNMAVGIAAGYLNVIGTMLGYGTGCCACYNPEAVKEIVGMENDPILLMGIGFKDEDRQRREHHVTGVKIPRRPKEEIQTRFIR